MRDRVWSSREAAALCEETGISSPAAAMRRIAAKLIDRAGFTAPPFDPEIVASMRNVSEVRRVPMTGAARLIPVGRFLRIEVNCEHSSGKQNFSIDHESSHTLLPTWVHEHVEDQETGEFRENIEEELLCDIGAAALLLDPRWLTGFAYEASPSIAFLQVMAKTFMASWEATARQLASVAPWSAAYVFWEQGFRKSDQPSSGQLLMPGLTEVPGRTPRLRMTRTYCTQSFPHRLYLNKSVPDTSLVASCNEVNPSTFGVEDIPLRSDGEAVRLYTENTFVPYRQNGMLRKRVVSLLLPITEQTNNPEPVSDYDLETL